VSIHSIHHHFIEARLRLKLASNDFSAWLEKELGLRQAAASLNRIDIYTLTSRMCEPIDSHAEQCEA